MQPQTWNHSIAETKAKTSIDNNANATSPNDINASLSTKGGVAIAKDLQVGGIAEIGNSLNLKGPSPTIGLLNPNYRNFWLHANENIFYILSDKNDDNIWEMPYPAYWADTTQKAYFWSREVPLYDIGTTNLNLNKIIANSLTSATSFTSDAAIKTIGGIAANGTSHLNKIVSSELSFLNTTDPKINLYFNEYTIGVQNATTYFRSGKNFAFYVGGNHDDEQLSPGGGTKIAHLNQIGDLHLKRHLFANYVNMNHAPVTRDNDTVFYSSTDDYIRKNNAEGMILSLGLDTRYLSVAGDSNVIRSLSSATSPTSSAALRVYGGIASNGTSYFQELHLNYLRMAGPLDFRFESAPNQTLYLRTFARGSGTLRNNIVHFNEGEIGYYKPLVNRSSRETKTIIGELSNCLDILNKLNPIFYYYNDDETQKIMPGFVAEEVPEEMMVTHGKSDKMMLNYVQMVAWTVGAIKELSAKVEKIEKKLNHENQTNII